MIRLRLEASSLRGIESLQEDCEAQRDRQASSRAPDWHRARSNGAEWADCRRHGMKVEEILQEIESMAMLDHPNVIKAGETGDHHTC